MEVKMIQEFKAFFTLFQQGKELTDSKVWKDRQIVGNTLVGVLGAIAVIAKGFGYDFHIDEQTIQAAAMGIAALYGIGNSILTVITSKKVGLK
jgi:hypothetical protein